MRPLGKQNKTFSGKVKDSDKMKRASSESGWKVKEAKGKIIVKSAGEKGVKVKKSILRWSSEGGYACHK